jgi:hypothetical protein
MKSNEQKDDDSVVFKREEISPDPLSIVKYTTIRSKMIRIKSALDKSKSIYNRKDTIDISNLFSLNQNQQTQTLQVVELATQEEEKEEDQSIEETYEISKPVYCRDESDRTPKKPPCWSCKSQCNLEENDLKSESQINRSTIEDELANHMHPKSRKIAGAWRSTAQAKYELLLHYRYAHKK